METILSGLVPLIALAVLILVVFGSMKAVMMGAFSKVFSLMVVGMLAMGGLLFFPQVIAFVSGVSDAVFGAPTESADDGEASPPSAAPTAEATPPSAPAEPTVVADQASAGGGADVPWLLILAVAGGIALVLIAGAIAVPVYRRRRDAAKARRAERKDRAVARERFYASLIARHDVANAAYNEFLLDIFAILERPALNDVTVATTAMFLDAHARAADLRPSGCPTSDEALNAYEAAVRDLGRTWVAADAHARKVGTNVMSSEERRRVTLAIRCLTTARNAAASAAERNVAYKKALELLQGIIPLQEQTKVALEIESRQVLALAA